MDESVRTPQESVKMTDQIRLRSSLPSDQPQILVWEDADRLAVRELCNLEDADYINYRDDLLHRTPAVDRFLVLDRYIDRELQWIRHLCATAPSHLVVLHELDALVAYLVSTPGKIANVFWDRLIHLRQLESRLWIVLPSSCVSPLWPIQRLETYPQNTMNGTSL
jgi:hypothetical protein